MLSRVALILVALLLIAPANTHAWPIHAKYVAPVCTPTAYVDGCAAASANGSFTVLTAYGQAFGPHARQSGQTWPGGDHPQPFNLPAVDYPIGSDSTASYTNMQSGSVPANCTYIASGGPGGGPRVVCNTAGVNYDIEHWNIIYQLQIGTSVTGSVKIANNRCYNSLTMNVSSGGNNCFKVGPSNAAATPISDALTTALGLSTITTEVSYNDVNGEAQAGSTACGGAPCNVDPWSAASLGGTGDILATMNDIINITGRPFTAGMADGHNIYHAFNYYDTVCIGSANHCEIDENIAAFGSTTGNYYVDEVFVASTQQFMNGTAVFYCATGQLANQTFSPCSIINSTAVVNFPAVGAHSVAAMIEAAYVNITQFTAHNNYFDDTGTAGPSCSVQTPSAQTFVGSISGTALTTVPPPTINSASVGPGVTITGAGIAGGTKITAGLPNSFTVNNSQTIAQESMTSGGIPNVIASDFGSGGSAPAGTQNTSLLTGLASTSAWTGAPC